MSHPVHLVATLLFGLRIFSFWWCWRFFFTCSYFFLLWSSSSTYEFSEYVETRHSHCKAFSLQRKAVAGRGPVWEGTEYWSKRIKNCDGSDLFGTSFKLAWSFSISGNQPWSLVGLWLGKGKESFRHQGLTKVFPVTFKELWRLFCRGCKERASKCEAPGRGWSSFI